MYITNTQIKVIYIIYKKAFDKYWHMVLINLLNLSGAWQSAEVMFRCFASVHSRSGAATASFLRDIHSKAVIVFQLKQNHLFMLCANFTQTKWSMYLYWHIWTYRSSKCSLYYDTLIIQIDLVVAEIFPVNYGQVVFQQRPQTEANSCQVQVATADYFLTD